MGRARPSSGWTSRRRATPTPTPPLDPTGPWPIVAPHRGGRAPPRRPPSWCARPRGPEADDARRGHARTLERIAAVGRRARAAARRGARATASPDVDVPLPSSLSATVAGPAARRPGRRSPATWPGRCRASRRRRPGSAPASTPGSRRGSASRTCSTPTSCPAAATLGIDDDDDLRELIEPFEDGPFADRVPHAVEPPFALVLAGQVVRGRIDAVYAEQVDGEDGFLVVDWKTNRAPDRRPAPARDLPRWPGPSWPACPSSGCGRRSTTSAPVTSSSPRTCRPRRARGAAPRPAWPVLTRAGMAWSGHGPAAQRSTMGAGGPMTIHTAERAAAAPRSPEQPAATARRPGRHRGRPPPPSTACAATGTLDRAVPLGTAPASGV